MLPSLKNLRFFAVSSAIVAIALSPAHAQKNEPPSGQFGVGIYAISTTLPSGLEGVYAISQGIQVGSELSLLVGNGTSQFLLSPFVRILFNSKVSPFLQGGFAIYSNGGTSSGLFMGGGIAYYLNHEIGLHADVDILDVVFSPSSVTFGWAVVRGGADWFF
jgi:hypothetical protein